MKITQAGIASEILAIVDKIQKATHTSGPTRNLPSGQQRRLEKAASELENVAAKLMEK